MAPERKREARRKRLACSLREASVSLIQAAFVEERTTLHVALDRLSEAPVLLVKNPVDPQGLLGMLTPRLRANKRSRKSCCFCCGKPEKKGLAPSQCRRHAQLSSDQGFQI
jgi:hypothetical protein